jgi:hypothetical protein
MKEHASKPVKGIHTDFTPKDQPENTYRFALNAVDETSQGDSSSISNEESNEICADLPEGYIPIGKCYIGDGEVALFLSDEANGDSEIGILKKDCTYETYVNDSAQVEKLNFKVIHQIDTTYRLRKGCDKTVYFVDGNNNDRYFNFNDVDFFKTIGGLWDIPKFRLDKTVDAIPVIDSIEIEEQGSLLPGSYNVAIALLDEDFNSTEIVNVSDTIIIYNDKYEEEFNSITGSTTEEADYYQNNTTGKSLRVNLSNLDASYTYYRIFLISANNASGRIASIAYTDDIPLSQTYYVLTGTNTPYNSSEAEILAIKAVIQSSKHIEQVDNRLIRANIVGDQRRYCDFQKLASAIKSDLALKEINLNDITAYGNPKRGTVHEENSIGYMPGEIYAFGIVYEFPENVESPAYHIPGRGPGDLTSEMSLENELDSVIYTEDTCLLSGYWGVDYSGDPLEGEKVRHHRFPTRNDIGIPLYDETDVVNTPTGNYIHSVKIVIDDTYNNNYNFDTLYVRVRYDNLETGELNVEYIKSFPNVYVEAGSPVHLEVFLPEIATTNAFTPYVINQVKFVNPQGNDGVFFIDPIQTVGPFPTVITYIDEPVLKKVVSYTSQILGIHFSNVVLPPGAIGYHIVRMERTDDEKTVLDTGLLFPLMKDSKYEAFAAFNPDNTITRGTERWAMFNPEYKFWGKEYTNIDRVIREAIYSVSQKTLFSNITQDVQPGTSYNKTTARKREEDEDGFDLHTLVRYNEIGYTPDGTELTNNVTDAKYLSALASTVMDGETVFNASADNKIGILEFDSLMGTVDSIPYVSLRRDLLNPYANFRIGKYYKEHTNIFSGDEADIFNGDTYISPMTLTSTIFYDIRLRYRSSKSGIWRIIGGVLLVAFGIVASILTLGLGIPATIAIIGAGVSAAASGINQAIIKKTYQEEYEKGLKDTIKDTETNNEFGGNPPDDEIQYFSDMLENIWFESSVNMNWRLDPNYGPQTFQYSPDFLNKNRINSYILDKLTVLDVENENGRLYQGYANAETYFYNDDYRRRNKQKIYFSITAEYDCCSDCLEEFPHRIHWSEQSFQEELTDHYRTFLPNDYRDIEGETGKITDLFKIQNNLYIHTQEGLWHLPQNIQERITGDIVSFIGTGSYFSIPPRRIVDDETGMSAGTQHKWATLKTPYFVAFVSEALKTIYTFDGNSLQPISSNGNFTWFKENIGIRVDEYWLESKGRPYPYNFNPANRFGVGFHSTYDSRKERLIITKRDLVFKRPIEADPILDQDDYEVTYYNDILWYFLGYQNTIDVQEGLGWTFVGIVDNTMVFEMLDEGGEVITSTVLGREVPDESIYQASWTYSYSIKNQAWRSFHSYLPNFYINTPDEYFSVIHTNETIWKHNRKGHYQNYYGVRHPFIIDYVSNSVPVETRLYNHIRLLTDARRYVTAVDDFVDERFITFNKAIFYNSRQCSGELTLNVKDTNVDEANYMFQQITNINADEIIIDRHERDWTLNDLRDFRTDLTLPIFNKNIEDLQTDYFIDKIVNTASLDLTKTWDELESFRDKYLALRFIFDTFDNIKLIVDYSIVNEQKSDR